MEDAHIVHAALGHQKMQVRVKVDPVPSPLLLQMLGVTGGAETSRLAGKCQEAFHIAVRAADSSR